MLKACKKCGVEKTLAGYYRQKESVDGYEHICKQCRNTATLNKRDKNKHNANAAAWRNKNKDKLRKQSAEAYHKEPEKRKNSIYITRYGITLEEATKLLIAQYGKCNICYTDISIEIGVPNTAHVDHCHSTGKVRGMLCSACNTGLGLFRDNQDNLVRAIEYLKRHE